VSEKNTQKGEKDRERYGINGERERYKKRETDRERMVISQIYLV
jgi:hypothetical protein